MSTVYLTEKAWKTIRQTLAAENPSSVMLISWRMRDRLGFSVREHRQWTSKEGRYRFIEESIVLDFYDEFKYTLFLLRFGNLISANPHRFKGSNYEI
jgi:hypothetical protein